MAVFLRRVALFPRVTVNLNVTIRGTASSNPHGGDGTAYKEREAAQEAVFIKKREEEAARLKAQAASQKVCEDGCLYPTLLKINFRF